MADVFTRRLGDSRSPLERRLFGYIRSRNVQKVQQLIKKHENQIDLTKRDPKGCTCLEEAVLHRDEEMVSLILSVGRIAPPVHDALILATKLRYDDIVGVLLEHRLQTGQRSRASRPTASSDSLSTNDVNLRTPLSNDNDSDVESDYGYLGDTKKPVPSRASVKLTLPFERAEASAEDDSVEQYYFPEPDPDPEPEHVTIIAASYSKRSRRGGTGRSCPTFGMFKFAGDSSTRSTRKTPEPYLRLSDDQKVLREACKVGDAEVIQSFLNMKVRLPTIDQSLSASSDDHLQDFSERLDIWKAITSPVYVGITNKDPVIGAFGNHGTMKTLSERYPEYKDDLKTLATRSEQFAVDLLDLCDTNDDVRTILSLDCRVDAPFAQLKYGRLFEALKYKQKKFVSHPNCQTFVNNLWTDGLRWREWSPPRKMLYVAVHAVLMPPISIVTALAAGRPCLDVAKIPLNRFIYSATSYVVFLALLSLYLILDDPPDELLWCIAAYACTAMLRVLVTDLPMHGIDKFVHTFWNMYDFVMYMIFLGAFSSIIYLKVFPIDDVLEVGDPMISIASILAFVRIFNWFHLHPSLGPFIIAFKKILFIVCRLLSVFTILFLAFAFSLHFLYKGKTVEDADAGGGFETMLTTFSALFWTVYGYGEPTYSEVEVSLHNSTSKSEATLLLTQYTGTFLWGLFHVACVIVLINMLIAMMTETFERIQEDCDTEWKFACTKMQLYYLEDCTAVPEPFNVVHSILVFSAWIYSTIRRKIKETRGPAKKPEPNDNCNVESAYCTQVTSVALQVGVLTNNGCNQDDEADSQEQEYTKLVCHLIRKYINRTTVQMRNEKSNVG